MDNFKYYVSLGTIFMSGNNFSKSEEYFFQLLMLYMFLVRVKIQIIIKKFLKIGLMKNELSWLQFVAN